MISYDVNSVQREAIEAAWDACVVIGGAPGTGKSTALTARFERARRDGHEKARFFGHPDELVELAELVLAEAGETVALIDDVEAELIFAQAAQKLFALEWDEFTAGQLDPEIPGLRSPERFLVSAFRLFRKLRDAAIDPTRFLESSLTGATNFYAKPPNFAHPSLIAGTKDAYRDSLDVDLRELQRQYRREIDLAKILAQLYGTYIKTLESGRTLTARDAVAHAIGCMSPQVATAVQARHNLLFIDEAQDLTSAQTSLLEAIYGAQLQGISLAGDPAGATNTFRGARPERAFAAATVRVTLAEQYRSPLALEIASRRLSIETERIAASNVPEAIVLHRAKTQDDEAAFIALRVREALDRGVPPDDIALVFRSTADVHAYVEALLERNVPAAVAGDFNVFTDKRVLDALALLWNVWDPFKHDWMLRTLSGHALALSDSSVAKLCMEPPDSQTALFQFDGENPPTQRSGRWDPKRDLRLGWNVIRGEQDAALTDVARERIARFRAQRARWVEAMQTLPFADFARLVWSEGLAPEGPPGSARASAQCLILERLLERLARYAARNPYAGAGDVLAYAGARAASDLEACEDSTAPGFVRILSIDAARGRSFRYVVLPDARAGSFPRWYVPDSFMFSPKLGMIPKDNVGDARASRTAKFSYYLFSSKVRDHYNAEERRAFVYAMRRSSGELLVTASGRATRGTSAPEFLEELRNARLPGVSIVE